MRESMVLLIAAAWAVVVGVVNRKSASRARRREARRKLFMGYSWRSLSGLPRR